MKRIKTRQGHTYLPTRPNFPNDFNDRMKDEILDRLAGKFLTLFLLQKEGMAKGKGEIGVVMVSMVGLFSPYMEAAFVPHSRMLGPMAPIAEVMEPGDFDPECTMAVCLFYDHRLQQAFHPNSDVGLFLLERAS